jgi:hypothetical protein
VTGRRRKLHNEVLHNLHFFPSIIRMIKSRRIRLAGSVARRGRRGMHICYRWEGQDVGRRIMLMRILER